MRDWLPDDGWLRMEAGDGAFSRGRAYHRDGQVELSRLSATALTGQAFGSDTYRLTLNRAGSGWRWGCECPAADGGAFCKHLVAAVLAARAGDCGAAADDGDDGDGDDGGGDDRSAPRRSRRTSDDLGGFLRAQPGDRLADWLMALAANDRDVERTLLLYQAASQPGAMKAALASVLATRGHLDYRRTIAYARRLDPAIEQLHDLLRRDPPECRLLCEYALKRLFGVIERCDDSAGSLGDRMAELAGLHARACAAAPPGKPLARVLHALQCREDWDLLPLDAYWEALGSQGQAAYGRLVLDAFERLPPPAADGFDTGGYAACRRVEALARRLGDFDLLQRVLRRDLSRPHRHLGVLESLREFGRGHEALAWAESAVKRFPDDGALRAALAECLAEAGLEDEALAQQWECFVLHPSAGTWDRLKRRAGVGWPEWRERALAHVQSVEQGQVSLRVDLLTSDGNIDAAVSLARAQPVSPQVLERLAARVGQQDPGTAGGFYLRLAQRCAESLGGPGD